MNSVFGKGILLVLTLGICACGIKPGFVEPPQGVENDQFPRTYPDPATDANS